MSLKVSLALAVAMAFGSAPTAFSGEDSSSSTAGAQGDDQKIKCRKIEVTGSLVRKAKACRTIAEWRRLQQLGNDAARTLAGEHVCSGGECRGIEPPPAPQ